MQNKLNEILELCVEKSNAEAKVFYRFTFSPCDNVIMIAKFVDDEIETLHCKNDIDFMLEYMQNE